MRIGGEQKESKESKEQEQKESKEHREQEQNQQQQKEQIRTGRYFKPTTCYTDIISGEPIFYSNPARTKFWFFDPQTQGPAKREVDASGMSTIGMLACDNGYGPFLK